MQVKEFDCGCKFPINENGGLDVKFTVDNINFYCQKTWDLIASGNTLGVFQLESYFAQGLAKDLAPEHIEHLSALAAIIRPGATESIRDEKSITQHYIDRRHNREPIVAYPKALEPILNKTLCEMIYQEHAISIATEIAGFTLQEADVLRKAIGKKKAEEMKELEQPFLEGCKRIGKVTEQEAKDIFESIRKSQRYSFNKCLHPKTLVELRGGCFRSLDTICVGDEIKCPTDDGFVFKKVINVYNTDDVELWKITLSNKLHIICSLDHKFIDAHGRIRNMKNLIKYGQGILTDTGIAYIDAYNSMGTQEAMDIEIASNDNDDYPHMFFANGGIITSNSHSVSYAINGYMTAYAKTHFPLIFFKNYLSYTSSKPDTFKEMKKLVFDAKKFNIEIQPPNLEYKNLNFKIIDGYIYYGLTNVRDIGDSAAYELLQLYNKYDTKIPWIKFLFEIALNVNKRCIKALIAAGALNMQMSRAKMLYEHELAMKINKRERKWIVENIDLEKNNLQEILEIILEYPTGKNNPIFNKNRYSIIKSILFDMKHPSRSLRDTPEIVATMEESLFGVSLTCSKLDGYNIDAADTTCKEFNSGKTGDMRIAGEMDRLQEHTTKKNEIMAFASIHDNTGIIEQVVIFPRTYYTYKHVLEENTPTIFFGKRTEKGSFSIEKCFNLK